MNAGSVHFEFGDASSLRDSLSRGLVEVLFRGFGEREDGRQGGQSERRVAQIGKVTSTE